MNRSTPPQRIMRPLHWLLVCSLLTTSCQDHQQPVTPDAATYSADVVTSWLTLQLKITQTTPAAAFLMPRRFAYAAISAYESIVPGLPGYQPIAPQLNGLVNLPTVTPGQNYYWPACANAALAAMNRNYYPTTSAANKTSIDSLETLFTNQFLKNRTEDELNRSADFGKKIAAAVFDWSKTDRYDDATPYTVPTGVGLWVPTPPALAAPLGVNIGKARPILLNSDAGADQGPPTPYSENPSSTYYAQAKEVFDVSQSRTAEQQTIALFWADNADGKSFISGHWLSILNQVLLARQPKLDVAMTAFVQMSIALSDAQISLFKSKYLYNTLRPITYIRATLNQPTWNALFATPAHPEYPSAHAVQSGAMFRILTTLFGANYKFTDNSYNLVGFSPRSYNSFEEAAIEAANSRLYGSIHYRKTNETSLLQGQQIAINVVQKLKFKR
jgi:hypothetical protein